MVGAFCWSSRLPPLSPTSARRLGNQSHEEDHGVIHYEQHIPFSLLVFLFFPLSIFPNLSKPRFTFQPEEEQTRYHLVTAQVSANARSKWAKNVPDILIQLQQSES